MQPTGYRTRKDKTQQHTQCKQPPASSNKTAMARLNVSGESQEKQSGGYWYQIQMFGRNPYFSLLSSVWLDGFYL